MPGSGTSTDGSSNSISFNPFGGYFIIDGIAVGAGISIQSDSFKPDGQPGKFTFSQLTVSPFGRYYHSSGFFGHLGFNFGSAKFKDDTGGSTFEDKNSVFGFGLGGGYAIFLNDNVAIEPLLMYESNSLKDKDSDVKDIQKGVVIRIGFNIFL